LTIAPATTVTTPAARKQAVGGPLAVVLSLLTVFGPISMDLYLPVLPALTSELRSATATAQLTVTACLFGLAAGQLVAGPLSDRFGRRRPLLISVVAYVLVSLLCAASPTVETLVAARLVQGLAGGVGVVIAQAAGRDLYSGGRLLRYYGRLTVLGGLAAIVGPVIGGQLASVTDWRRIFVFLAAVGAAILLACLLVFRETLPADRRVSGGLAQTGRDMRRLLSDRVFLGSEGVADRRTPRRRRLGRAGKQAGRAGSDDRKSLVTWFRACLRPPTCWAPGWCGDVAAEVGPVPIASITECPRRVAARCGFSRPSRLGWNVLHGFG
jgi:MFS transporter, DHA1 family, multidrug resistance protein